MSGRGTVLAADKKLYKRHHSLNLKHFFLIKIIRFMFMSSSHTRPAASTVELWGEVTVFWCERGGQWVTSEMWIWQVERTGLQRVYVSCCDVTRTKMRYLSLITAKTNRRIYQSKYPQRRFQVEGVLIKKHHNNNNLDFLSGKFTFVYLPPIL